MKKYILSLILLGLLCVPVVVFAQKIPKLNNPLGTTDIPVLTGSLIEKVLGLVGIIALVMFIYGGITWMVSSGQQELVQRGRRTITWAAIGLVFVFIAYTVVHFLLESLGQ